MPERPSINFDAADFQTRHTNRSRESARRRLGIRDEENEETQNQEQEQVAPVAAVETTPAAVVETPAVANPAEEEARVRAEQAARQAEAERQAREAAATRERELREKVDRARGRYLTMQREKERASGIKGFFNGDRKRLGEIQTQLDAVEAEYKHALEEYKAVKAEEMIFEADRVAEDKAKMISGEKSENKFTKWYKTLGETRFGKDIKNQTGVKKFLNNRTFIGLGLAGIAIATGPVGWVGGGAMVARRLWSALGSGVGSRELFLNMRRANIDKEIPDNLDTDQLFDWIQTARARAAVDGTMGQLAEKENYLKATRLWKEKAMAKWEHATPEQRAEYSEHTIELGMQNLNDKLSKEKSWNRSALYVGVAMGVFVGSGKLNELIRGKLFGSTNVESASAASVKPIAVETIAKPELTSLKIGGRGIEGALLDHLKTDKGGKMLEWLQAKDYNKGVTDKGALVHRFVSDYAKEHGYNIDQGGGKDLSKILGADLKVAANGEIQLGAEKFMAASKGVVEQATNETSGSRFKPLPDNFDSQELTPQDSEPVESKIPRPPYAEGVMDPEAAREEMQRAIELRKSITLESPILRADLQPEAVEQASSDGVTTPENEFSEVENMRYEVALKQDKSSTALQLMLGKEYTGFRKSLGLSNSDFDAIRKLNYSEFLQKLDSSESFANKYHKLAELTESKKVAEWSALNMKQVLISIVRAEQKGA